MHFTIAGFHSTDAEYQAMADLTVPTWRANSGADRVDIYPFEGCQSTDYVRRRYENIGQRCLLMQGVVQRAVERQERLLLLDIDGFVVKNLSSGFCDSKPWSVTRWPRLSMAVLFLNTHLPWPFVDFFSEFTRLGYEACMAASRARDSQATPEQSLLASMLVDYERDLHHLPLKEWNYIDRSSTTREDVLQDRDSIRIYQIVFNAFRKTNRVVSHLRKIFPELLKQ